MLIFAGIYAALFAARRLAELEAVVLMISLIENDVSYVMTPIPELVGKLSTDASMCRLDFLQECFRLCLNGADFPYAWQTAIGESCTLLNTNERNTLTAFGVSLCSNDKNGQLNLCALCKTNITKAAGYAEQFKRKYSGMFVASGIMAAILFCILIL